MDKMDSDKSIFDRIKSLWNSLPGFVRFIGTLLSIVIAVKALVPAAAMDINHFGASPEVIGPGDTSVLSWDVSGESNVSIEPGIGTVGSNGSISVSPSQTTTYKLILSGEGKEKTASCTITVSKNSPLITSFEASPNTIKAGESAVLNWHATGASNVNIEPDIGAVESSDTLSVSPIKTTTYTLTASNDDKKDVAHCTITVEGNFTSSQDNLVSQKNNSSSQNTGQVNQSSQSSQSSQTNQENLPTINFFNANPDLISKGGSANLTWNVLSAAKVSIEPGIGTVGLTGSQRIFPSQNTIYTLTATNEFGSVHAIKVVYVQESSATSSSTSPSSTSTSSTTSSTSNSSTSTSTPSSSSSSSQASSKALSTPKQLSPANGTTFDNSTSGTTLEWTDVSGATSYTVEIDTFDSNSNSWLSESTGSNVVSGIKATSYSFDFSTVGPVRWRVWAVGSDGGESKKSEWWSFNSS